MFRWGKGGGQGEKIGPHDIKRGTIPFSSNAVDVAWASLYFSFSVNLSCLEHSKPGIQNFHANMTVLIILSKQILFAKWKKETIRISLLIFIYIYAALFALSKGWLNQSFFAVLIYASAAKLLVHAYMGICVKGDKNIAKLTWTLVVVTVDFVTINYATFNRYD